MRTLTDRDLQKIKDEFSQIRTLISGLDASLTRLKGQSSTRADLESLSLRVDAVQQDLADWTAAMYEFLHSEEFVTHLAADDIDEPVTPPPTNPPASGGGGREPDPGIGEGDPS